MTPQERFPGPWLKLQRAKKHIVDFNRAVLQHARSDPYRIVEDRKSQQGYHSLRFVCRHGQPGDWPVIIGDAVHNLRCSLDILACDVMRFHGRGVSSVHFPFCKDIDDLEETMRSRTVHRARPDIVDLFRSLKPYPGGNAKLCAIHEMDVRDKHKVVTPVVHFPAVTNIEVLRRDGSHVVKGLAGIILPANRDVEMFRFPASLQYKYNYDRKPTFKVVFGEGPLKGEPVIETLRELAQIVEEVICLFAKRLSNPTVIVLGYSR